MLRKLVFVCILATIITLIGCEQKEDKELPEKSKPIVEDIHNTDEELKTLEVDPSKFHFVADWLTDSQIIIVERDNGYYYVKSFDIHSGEMKNLYEESSIIVDVLIHPSKDYILIHSTNNPTSATIRILKPDGTLFHEISIQSSELLIEWNGLDPSLVLLTAFHQDWTFDVFLFNGNEDKFGLIDIEDPFPKWVGTDRVVFGKIIDHALDGGELYFYDPSTGKQEPTELSGVVHFDTYEESILIVRILESGEAVYSMIDDDLSLQMEWKMPAVSNYSEWVFRDLAWISKDTLYVPSPDEGGQLDEIGPYHLKRVMGGQQDVLVEDIEAGLLRCSPDGQKCLTGYTLSTIVDIEKKEKINWLTFLE